MPKFLTLLKNKYVASKGFHTKRKLVVIESDDWGSIRMPSKKTLDKLQAIDNQTQNNAFLRNDCLEREKDVAGLYDVLKSVEDCKGNNPVITLNFATANPDFDNIDYENGVYSYEPFYDTYKRYYGENSTLDLVKKGVKEKVFCPQLHCREHLNIGRWMNDLKNNLNDARLAFECKTMGVFGSFGVDNPFGYMDAFNSNYSSAEDFEKIILDACKIFYNAFGYKSETFVASCFVWDSNLETILKRNDINYIQSAVWQNIPLKKGKTCYLKRKLRYTGQRNKLGQVYGTRNCSFEPAYKQNPEECVKSCLSEVDNAFKSKKPAIINSHRLNYIGAINPENSVNNLKGLKSLLQNIVQTYPDVEFVSTAELFSIINQEKK